MIEEIADLQALLAQAEGLKRKRFSPGFDGMTPEGVAIWLTVNRDKLLRKLRSGSYTPMPVLTRAIAKKDGKPRFVGRITAIDTVIQRLTAQVLSQKAEPLFSDSSFAYRPGRGVAAALSYYCTCSASFRCAAKVDFLQCYDHMDHQVLAESLKTFTDDPAVIRLILAFAKAPRLWDGELTENTLGIHQGSPLSPLLCNIYLHSLDQLLTRHQIPFIRYADDVVLFGNQLDTLREQTALVIQFARDSLKLEVNPQKTDATSCDRLVYLGHRFTRDSAGFLRVCEDEPQANVFYSWNRISVSPHRYHTRELLQDGILRQKDFSAIFDTEEENHPLPLESIDFLNLYGNVILDAGFLKKTAEAGVTIQLFDPKTSQLLGTFTPNAPLKAEKLTYAQLSAYHQDAHRLALAKEFVLAANHNLRLNLRYYKKHRESPLIESAIARIYQLDQKIKSCDSHEQLLLLEAQSKNQYYGCFDIILENSPFRFQCRSRKPPRNEVNALLSFGNTVLYNYLATAICKTALDIRVGFLHATGRRLHSLNLDFADVYKPLLVDRTVFALINRREIRPCHFEEQENGAVYLNRTGKQILLQAMEEKVHTTLTHKQQVLSYTQIMQEDIYRLVRHFKGTEAYKAFRQVK